MLREGCCTSQPDISSWMSDLGAFLILSSLALGSLLRDLQNGILTCHQTFVKLQSVTDVYANHDAYIIGLYIV